VTNPIREGWAQGPPRMGIKQRWHYYAGIGDLGGRFRSLCRGSTYPADGPLTTDMNFNLLRSSRHLPCKLCLMKLVEANKHSAVAGGKRL